MMDIKHVSNYPELNKIKDSLSISRNIAIKLQHSNCQNNSGSLKDFTKPIDMLSKYFMEISNIRLSISN